MNDLGQLVPLPIFQITQRFLMVCKDGLLLARVFYNVASISLTCFSSMCEEAIHQAINYENNLTFPTLCKNMLMKTKKE